MRAGWLVSAVLLLPSLGAVGQGQKHERKREERSQIAILEEQWRKAQLSADVPEMDHLLSDDFLGVTATGEVVTKSQQLDRMRTHQFQVRTLDVSDTKIKISGNLAVVTSFAKLDATTAGRPFVGSFRYTRVYQHKTGDGWKITNFEATRVGREAPAAPATASSPQAHAGEPPAGAPSSHQASLEEFGSPRPRS